MCLMLNNRKGVFIYYLADKLLFATQLIFVKKQMNNSHWLFCQGTRATQTKCVIPAS